MNKFLAIAKSRASFLVVSAFAPVCFGMLLGGVDRPSRLQSPTRNDTKIINKTTTLEVVSLQVTEHNHLIVVFRNVSAKDLNGYAVAMRGGMMTVDMSSGDHVIPSGQTDNLEVPLDSPVPDLTILAAMFADGSIEGDKAIVVELKEWRLGLKKQLILSLSDLDATLGSPDVDAATALDRLEFQFSNLSPESDIAQLRSASGSRSARGDLISEIGTLRERRQRNGALMQRQRLLDLKARIQRRIASL